MSTAELPSRPVRPLRRVEYDALVMQGFLDGEGVELIDGQLVLAAEEGPPHAATIRRLSRLLFDVVPASEAEIAVGNPLAATDLSEPEPDLMLIPPARTYRAHHPRSASLVIEVSRSSRHFDLGVKARIYAQAAVPDYWVVDLVQSEVVVHRDPVGGRYADVTRHGSGEPVQALRHPAVVVGVDWLLD